MEKSKPAPAYGESVIQDLTVLRVVRQHAASSEIPEMAAAYAAILGRHEASLEALNCLWKVWIDYRNLKRANEQTQSRMGEDHTRPQGSSQP